MTEVADAIRRARDAPSSENLEAMWRRVFALPAWYLLPAELDAETTPLVAQVDDGAWLIAFTHFRALNDFTRLKDMRSDTGEVPMLALSPVEAMKQIEEHSDHIDGVLFNAATELTFRTPVAALRELAARLHVTR